ncbi:MAG: hypothetical protein IPI67_24565 [Myxococcales bacterium]|nr:hypothetical protein [Myxococcales bacterium]
MAVQKSYALVGATATFPARLKVTPASGPSAGVEKTFVLAGGKVFGSESGATAAGENLAQLGSVSVHADPSGTGAPIAFVGSSDGWLYGFAACSSSLAFTKRFAAAVGNVVFGDTDGDGNDEILVAVADGYLYALDQADVTAPVEVRDIDPNDSSIAADVDDVFTFDTLAASWDAVPGADSYSVAVVRADLTGFVAPWQTVGNVTKTNLTGLDLLDGGQYIFAVRSLKGGAISPDAVSDGVVVHKTAKPQADAGPDSADAGPDDGGVESDAPSDAADASDGNEGGSVARPRDGHVAGGGCDCRQGRGGGDTGRPLGLLLGLATVLGFARRRR